MALSVVLAMLASYVLSRTLVPTLSRMLMEHEHLHHDVTAETKPTLGQRFNHWRDENFEKFRASYGRLLHTLLLNKSSLSLSAGLGYSYYRIFCSLLLDWISFAASTDAGLMKLPSVHHRERV